MESGWAQGVGAKRRSPSHEVAETQVRSESSYDRGQARNPLRPSGEIRYSVRIDGSAGGLAPRTSERRMAVTTLNLTCHTMRQRCGWRKERQVDDARV